MPAPQRSRPKAYPRDAQGLVAWAIDCFEKTYDATMPRRTIGAYTKAIKEMLEDGVEWRVLYEAIRLSVEHGRSVAALPQLIVPATKNVRQYAGLRLSQVERAREYVEEHGWPTGYRFVRGTHSGVYVLDPLGHDRPPPAVEAMLAGHSRPTIKTIATALGEEEK